MDVATGVSSISALSEPGTWMSEVVLCLLSLELLTHSLWPLDIPDTFPRDKWLSLGCVETQMEVLSGVPALEAQIRFLELSVSFGASDPQES